MLRRGFVVLAAVVAVALSSCSSGSTSSVSPSTPIAVTSAAFGEGKLIPANFTCIQDDTPPPLAWTPQPDGTKEWAIVMEDTDANFVHWVVTALPAKVHSIAANQLPKGAVVSQDSNGSSGYHGPCPPTGQIHHYRITLYALSHAVQLNAKTPTKTALAAIQSAAIDHGALTARFAR